MAVYIVGCSVVVACDADARAREGGIGNHSPSLRDMMDVYVVVVVVEGVVVVVVESVLLMDGEREKEREDRDEDDYIAHTEKASAGRSLFCFPR
jgi:hypothetical protein